MTPEQLYAEQQQYQNMNKRAAPGGKNKMQMDMIDPAGARSETASVLNGIVADNKAKAYESIMVNRQKAYNDQLQNQLKQTVGLGNGNIIAGSKNINPPGKITTLKDVVTSNGTTSPYYLDGATRYAVPGAAHGQRGSTDSLIVHRTAGHGFHPNDPRLTKDGLGAHLTITRDGKVHQVGSLDDKMWHAGPDYNNRSIGMEVTGKYVNGAWEPMTDLQKASVDKYGRMIVDKYKIPVGNIKHHASVAAKTKGEGLQVENYLRNLYLQ